MMKGNENWRGHVWKKEHKPDMIKELKHWGIKGISIRTGLQKLADLLNAGKPKKK